MLQNDNSPQRVTFEEALNAARSAWTVAWHRNLNRPPVTEVVLDIETLGALLRGIDDLRSGS